MGSSKGPIFSKSAVVQHNEARLKDVRGGVVLAREGSCSILGKGNLRERIETSLGCAIIDDELSRSAQSAN